MVCALPYEKGKPGADCNGKHTIVYSTYGTSPSAKVTAELLALDEDGTVIGKLNVLNGDTAQIASRIKRTDAKLSSKKKEHQIQAPIPLLRVTVEDQGEKATAYCSNVPFLQVVEPKGQIVSESDGNKTNVVAAIPLIDGPSLDLKIDGVHIFDSAHLNLNPATCTATTPCNGVVNIKGAAGDGLEPDRRRGPRHRHCRRRTRCG